MHQLKKRKTVIVHFVKLSAHPLLLLAAPRKRFLMSSPP